MKPNKISLHEGRAILADEKCEGCGADADGWSADDIPLCNKCAGVSAEEKPESNWDRCLKFAREINKDQLIRDLLRQIERMRPKRYPRELWSYVGEATDNGCGYSQGIVAVYYPDCKDNK